MRARRRHIAVDRCQVTYRVGRFDAAGIVQSSDVLNATRIRSWSCQSIYQGGCFAVRKPELNILAGTHLLANRSLGAVQGCSRAQAGPVADLVNERRQKRGTLPCIGECAAAGRCPRAPLRG